MAGKMKLENTISGFRLLYEGKPVITIESDKKVTRDEALQLVMNALIKYGMEHWDDGGDQVGKV